MYKIYSKLLVPPPGAKKIIRAMKLIVLILTTAILQVSANTYAQKVTLSEKNAPLTKIFNQISRQSGLDFLVTKSVLEKAKPVTIKVTNAELKDVLKQIFENQPLEYEITDKSVLVREKIRIVDKGETVLTNPISVNGFVLDENNKPLQGVTIKEKSTNHVVTSGEKGDYYITLADENATLVFSFIGYETLEIIAKKLSVNGIVTLRISTTNLKEVVVNKGYYNTTQELNTGDVSKVSKREIEEQPVGDPILALEGRVAGLYISQKSGVPGSSSTVMLRGMNSIANGNAPLYIVDGVPYNATSLTTAFGTTAGPAGIPASPFDALNPMDIESIEVLKDADATSIYGSRGANGVILISLKRGRPGKTAYTINSSTGFGKVTKLYDLLNSSQYLALRHEMLRNTGLQLQPSDYDLNGKWDTTRYTDWQKIFIGGTSHYTNLNGSVSGGDQYNQFLFSVNYLYQTTVFPGDYDTKKISPHFNFNHISANKRFNALVSASYTNENNTLPPVDLTSNIFLPPDAPALYDNKGNLNWQGSTWTNPFASLTRSYKTTTSNLLSNLTLSYLILPGLQLRGNIGYNRITLSENIYNPFASYNPALLSAASILRRNTFSSNNVNDIIGEPQVDYHVTLGESSLTVLAGATLENNNQIALTQVANGFSSDALIANPAAATKLTIANFNNTQYRYAAIFGRINYNLKQKYILNITARRDGSSRFGPGMQFGNFGSIGAAWIFSKESFFQNIFPMVSFAKLRTSYGTVGNDQINDYQFLSTYTPNSQTYQGSIGLYPTSLTNPNYSWELNKKLEVGLELGLIQDKIQISISYYKNKTANQLVGYSLPSITGFTTIQENLPAVVQNTGLEVSLNTVNIKEKDFSWSTSFNLTIPKNKLISYPDLSSSSYRNIYIIGKSLFEKQVYHYTGVDKTSGLFTFEDYDHDGNISYPNDNKYSRFVGQNYFGGFSNTFRYKSVSLDILLQYVKQTGYNYLNSGSLRGLPGGQYNLPTYLLDHWQNPGDIANGQIISFQGDAINAFINAQNSNLAIGDASFVRCKNLSISYSLPADGRQNIYQSMKLFLQCQNLFTLTHYKGLDPEVQGAFLPPIKIITVGAQIIF